MQIYINMIKNRIVFKIKTSCKWDLWTSEKMKLLGSTKRDVDQDKNSENEPKLEYVKSCFSTL